ncbi:MAG: methylated-DNA--[protein]-cysteine S-methyltransferase [Oscillospiraceae bacterium]|nr:methylated-DNA--[protein]-cysteine S-methyltransferase [Oscillospiraceae bacterium]
MTACTVFDSPAGKILIAEEDRAITLVGFLTREPPPEASDPPTPLLKEAAMQLSEYFAGARREFDLPLRLRGTQFQLAVWNALRAIPYGETRSYADIAAAVGNEKACRAVGMANHRNPVSIIVPCHRVIGKGGSLTGYGGGIDKKEFLLSLERRVSQG